MCDDYTVLKRTAAILLILILLFNIVGYRWAFSYLEEKATQRLESRIDAGQYSDDQLLEIKISLKVPYYTDTKYEACYGETEFNGEHYRYVKRKVTGDTLYLLCIPHIEKDKIITAKTDFTKAVNDNNTAPQKQGQPSFVKLMMSEFLEQGGAKDFVLSLSVNKIPYSQDQSLLPQTKPGTPERPPKLA